MKKVLVDIDKKEYKKIDKKAIDIIEATSEIQLLSESNIKTYINTDLHKEINKNIENGLKNYSPQISQQAILDFSVKQGISETKPNLAGLIVRTKTLDENMVYFESFDALILKVDFGDVKVATIAPITYDLRLASDRSIVVNQHPYMSLIFEADKKFQPFAILLEYEIQVFLDTLDFSKTKGFFSDQELRNIIDFSDSGKLQSLNYRFYNLGIPFVDYFDTRINERNVMYNDFLNVSKPALSYIKRNRTKDKIIDSLSITPIHYPTFDAVFYLGKKDVSTLGKNVANNIKKVERILQVA